jgi:hypothetical protein
MLWCKFNSFAISLGFDIKLNFVKVKRYNTQTGKLEKTYLKVNVIFYEDCNDFVVHKFIFDKNGHLIKKIKT